MVFLIDRADYPDSPRLISQSHKSQFIRSIIQINTRFLLFLGLIQCLSLVGSAQTVLTLPEVIEIAKSQSPSYVQASGTRKNLFWQYRTYLSNYNPQLLLSGTIPSYNRFIQSITLPDGRQSFVPRSFMTNSTQLGLVQNIAATGGSISISTALQRIDLIGQTDGTSYLSTPVFITLNQPLFQFNNLRWDRRIQPILYEESVKRYNEDIEAISVRATELFFGVLEAQMLYTLAVQNRANNDTIFQIAQGRYDMGKIAENDLLQIELNVMNSGQQVTQSQLNLATSKLALRNYLGGRNLNEEFSLEEPKTVASFEIDENSAIIQAKQNRQAFLSFKRRMLEAERDLAQARQNTQGISVNINGSLGFTQSAATLGEAYQNPQNQQIFSVDFRVPILNWGRQKARVQTALANQEVVKARVEQDELNFEQEIRVKVRQFQLLRQRLAVGIRSDEIAQRRYDISQQRYLIGKISITDLNIALQDKNQARTAYIAVLRDYWRAYYELRQLTLFDFERNMPIQYASE